MHFHQAFITRYRRRRRFLSKYSSTRNTIHKKKKKYIIKMKIVILNAPCNGFGDVVYAYKLYAMLKKTYDVILFTTRKKDFTMLTNDTNEIHSFVTKNGTEITNAKSQCRRFSNIRVPAKLSKSLNENDIYINAPLQTDFIPSVYDISVMLSFKVKNVLIMTEYNHPENDHRDVLSIGAGEAGLIYPNMLIPEKYENGNFKFTIAYAADNETQALNFQLHEYFKSFKKTKTLLEVHCNPIVYNWYKKNTSRRVKNVRLDEDEDKGENVVLVGGKFPIPYLQMLSAWKNCSGNLFCTGDQSVSDAIYYNYNKNKIYYQVMGWKLDLALGIKKEWKNARLRGTKTRKNVLLILPPTNKIVPSAQKKIEDEIKNLVG